MNTDVAVSIDVRSLGEKVEKSITEKQGIISSGQQGKKFLKGLRVEVDRIKTLKTPKALPGFGNWTPDHHVWFAESISILDKGARLGEAPMLYLAAELLTFSTPDYIKMKTQPGLNRELWLSDKKAPDLYLAAAEKGFQPALLWCAFCLSKGVYGFDKDEAKSAHLLGLLKESGVQSVTVDLPELQFLSDEAYQISEDVSEADRLQDDVSFDYHENRIDRKTFERWYPNPDWCSLQRRLVDMATFMVSMGLPYVLERIGYYYEWTRRFDFCAKRVLIAKCDWQTWLEEQKLFVNCS